MFISKGFKLVIICTVMLLSISSAVFAQQEFADADSAAEFITQNYNALINRYIISGVPMPAAEVDKLEEETVKSRSIMKYRREFEGDAKFQFNMIYAFIEYFRGEGDKAVNRAKSVLKAAEDNEEMRDCYLYLAYMNKDYDGIKRSARSLELGTQASESVAVGNGLLANEVQKFMASQLAAAQAQALAMPARLSDPNNATGQVANAIAAGSSDPNVAGASSRSQVPVPMGGEGRFGAGGPANTVNNDSQTTRPRGNRGSRGNRGNNSDGGMGYGIGMGMGVAAPVDSNRAFERDSSRSNQRAGNNNIGMGMGLGMGAQNRRSQQSASASSASLLKLRPAYMPTKMLGQKLEKITLQDINGSFMSYSPDQGKILCMLLWSYGDSMLPEQRRSLLKSFTDSMGGFGLVQFVSVNCNELTNPLAMKCLVDDIVKAPSPWVNCVMTPENKKQLTSIEPASPVVLIAGTDGTVRYVGPANNPLVNAIMIQESLSMAGSLGGMSQFSDFMSSENMQQNIQEAMDQAMEAIKDQTASMASQLEQQISDNSGVTPVQTESNSNRDSAPKTKVKKITIEDDPTILQARNKLEVIRLKMGKRFAVQYGSALELCDEIIEGWPDSEEAEEAKAFVRDILSKSRGKVYKKDRIRDGKYVGDE